MAGSRLLKGIYVVGYLTTAIVLAEALVLGYAAGAGVVSEKAARARAREDTRTHDRSLGDYGNLLEAYAARIYRPVRPAGGSDEAVGFVFMPSSLTPWSATSIRLPRGADAAEGEMVFVRHDDRTRQLTFSQVQTFTVPKAAYLVTAQQIDDLTDRWPGDGRGWCFDGAIVAFERIKAGHVSSGVGNAGCDPHYAAVGKAMEPLLSRFGPRPPSSAVPRVSEAGPSVPAAEPNRAATKAGIGSG